MEPYTLRLIANKRKVGDLDLSSKSIFQFYTLDDRPEGFAFINEPAIGSVRTIITPALTYLAYELDNGDIFIQDGEIRRATDDTVVTNKGVWAVYMMPPELLALFNERIISGEYKEGDQFSFFGGKLVKLVSLKEYVKSGVVLYTREGYEVSDVSISLTGIIRGKVNGHTIFWFENGRYNTVRSSELDLTTSENLMAMPKRIQPLTPGFSDKIIVDIVEYPVAVCSSDTNWMASFKNPELAGMAETSGTKLGAFKELMTSLTVKIAYDNGIDLTE